MPCPEPVVDLTKIDFPSDKLNVKKLRELYPNKFDHIDQYGNVALHADAGAWEATLANERRCASRAFNAAMGRPFNWNDRGVHDPEWYDQEREWVRAAYIRWGLATGEHHAEQLLRSVEQVAAEQAKAYALPSR